MKCLCVPLLMLLALMGLGLRAAESTEKADPAKMEDKAPAQKKDDKAAVQDKVDKTVAPKEEQQRFHFTMEALGLFRTEGAEPKQIVGDFINSKDLQDSGELSVAPKLTFSYDITKNQAIEASYFGFGLMDWEGSRSLSFLGEGEIGANYRSELNHNAELTYRRTLVASDSGRLLAGSGVLGGLRYLNIDEALNLGASIDTGNEVGTVKETYSTSNDLIGGQIGGVLALNPHKRIRIELTGKAAFMANLIDKKDQVDASINALIVREKSSTDQTEFAFVGDLSAKVSGRVHKNIWLTAGYSAMFVEGVALAPEQEFLQHKIKTGDVIYHGFTAGVTIKW